MTAAALSLAQAVPLDAKVRFLSSRHAYPALNEPVATRETHMSWVFLAGEKAYKLKKPVRFPYLDFSTLARREAACRAELRLNRRLARDVYLDLAPLTLGPGGLSVGGPGKTVDWLIVMRRLDERRMLEARLRDHVRASELDRLADVLIQFYRHAPRTSLSPEGHLRRWRQALVNDRRILLEPRLGLPAGRVRWIDTELRRFLRTGRKQLDRRVHLGRILDLHGDLRPEHIWLADGVRIIDCLEFSAPLRAGDPLDEIAFLDLECERAGAPEAGRRIRERVARGLGESPNTPLYSFYRCHRAMLRARLCIAHLLEPKSRTPERWPRLARHYLDLACRDALALR